ncbi:MAG: hypothetical protein O3A51_12410, partial [Verrucomicrobia bacterium]|nr:hypothetical protein [Verrucomicrobiota bacterium]
PKAIQLVQKTATRNQLSITTVARGLTVSPTEYATPTSSGKQNRLKADSASTHVTSLTFREAADRFGVPALVKMDIEEGEREFFESPDFKQWIVDNKIIWLVEIHAGTKHMTWEDVPYRRIGNGLGLVHHADPEVLASISPPLAASTAVAS